VQPFFFVELLTKEHLMPVWRLPDYVTDVLPPEARKLEALRRTALDEFKSCGFQLVQPPLLEYLESLLTGTGKVLDLQTFKLVDQLSGKTLGLRADMTAQTARIDAHLLNHSGVTRLAYCGPILHTRPRSATATREPLSLGAELYGYAGIEADLECIGLLLSCVQRLGIGELTLSISHAGVLRHLLGMHEIDASLGSCIADCLQAKDISTLAELNLPAAAFFDLSAVLKLCGPPEQVFALADLMTARHPEVGEAFEQLRSVVKQFSDDVSIIIDIADSHGYQYHTGLTFALLTDGAAGTLARGGRYDTVGKLFGRARPATGFSMDLRELAQYVPDLPKPHAITTDWHASKNWRDAVNALREAGEIVIVRFPGDNTPLDEFICAFQLVAKDGHWQQVAVSFNEAKQLLTT
jgi:ATP phosphoribosyltransferase regulatory subunit